VRKGAALIAVALLIAGCGGDDGSGDEQAPPPANAADFPEVGTQRLKDLLREAGSGPVLAPSAQEFRTGRSRVGFALFNTDRSQITDATVALYVERVSGGPAQGPFPARYESLEVKPQFQSRQTSADPDAARSIYTAEIDFERPGRYNLAGIVRRGGELVAATTAVPGISVRSAENDPIPTVGEEPPRIHTPTEDDAAGNIASIDTRLPPSSMHEADFADVLGKKPVVLLFATPQLCQSRVCGPVVDIAEQVKASHGGRTAFIHMEIYEDNEVDKGFRPQVARFGLPSEPWAFAIERRGVVVARLEGAFSAQELRSAVQAAEGG
jgi:hypothetical protein